MKKGPVFFLAVYTAIVVMANLFCGRSTPLRKSIFALHLLFSERYIVNAQLLRSHQISWLRGAVRGRTSVCDRQTFTVLRSTHS